MTQPIPAAALSQHIAILGKTGSGKSYAAKGIVERLLRDGRQVCVLDPTAAWWGLRLASDGKGRGFDVVLLGGAHADIPLVERSGAAVARLVTQQGASVVIDTSGFTVGEYTRWFIDFSGTLYTTIRSPLHIVIDEAHYFMPQGGGGKMDVDTGKMLHSGNRLMSGGRSLGIRGLMITQRPAKLHKDSLTCADTLIAMRVIAPQDRGAIKEWIDGAGDPVQGKAVLDSLAQLKRGEGWVWYPEGQHLERVTFPKINTYDSSATPTHGAKAGPKVSDIKLDEVKAALAEAVKEAEANDPKLLRKRISELEAAKVRKESGRESYNEGYAEGYKAAEKGIDKIIAARDREWKGAVDARDKIIGGLKGRMGKAAELLHVNGEAAPQPVLPRTATTSKVAPLINKPKPASAAKREPTGIDLPGYQMDILRVALSRNPVPTPRAQLAALAHKSTKSSAFNPNVSALVDGGLLQETRGGYLPTDDAMRIYGADVSAPVSGAEALQHWIRTLPDYEGELLRVISEHQPASTEEISAQSGKSLTSSAFPKALKNLSELSFVVRDDDCRYVLGDVFT